MVSGALLIAAAMGLQAVLGILTLLNAVPIDLALTHQAGAIVVLTLVLLQAARVNRPSVEQGVATATPMVAVSGGRR